ncbi:MAG TPA: type II toxin-antitoxin system RelE/ParE family toxin [Candidatus Thermoplasmatota archaeon]
MTRYEVLLSQTAHKQLSAAGAREEARLRRGLTQLETEPFRRRSGADIKKLRGAEPPLYRLRVGDWRALYFVEGTRVMVTSIRRREGAYD